MLLRSNEKDSIKNCLLSYNLFENMEDEHIDMTVRKIERSIVNASIDMATHKNIPKYWDDVSFVDLYSNISYNIKINIDPESSVLCDKSDDIKFHQIEQIYNSSLLEALITKKYITNDISNILKDYIPTIDLNKIGYMNSFDLNPKINEPYFIEKRKREQEKLASKFSTMYKCDRCGEKKTDIQEVQRRSSDEGSTLQITCLVCGAAWYKN